MGINATYVDWNLVYVEQHSLMNSLNHHERYEFVIVVHNHQNYDFFQRLVVLRDEIRLPNIEIDTDIHFSFFNFHFNSFHSGKPSRPLPVADDDHHLCQFQLYFCYCSCSNCLCSSHHPNANCSKIVRSIHYSCL